MLIISILFFLSRLPFLRAYPVFYDSFEYSRIAEAINFFNFTQVIISSHQPIHTFYFLTILILKQIFFFLPTDKILVLISLIFGYLTTVFFFLFVKEYLDDKKAFFASLLLLLFPYFFIANTNILYESELLFFQIAGIYFFHKAVVLYKTDMYLHGDFVKFFFLASLFFGLSLSMFIGSFIILPVFFALYLAAKTKVSPLILSLFLALALFIPLLLDILVFKSFALIVEKYQSHFSDLVSSQEGLVIFIFRILRNIVLESSAILSWPGAIIVATVLLVSLFYPLFYPLSSTPIFNFLSSIVWFSPPILHMQFWHAGLFGRLAIFLVFSASLLLAKNLTKKWQKISLLLVLFFLLIPKLLAQTQRPPIYKYYELIKDASDVAILTSDSNRSLYQRYQLPTFVFSPGNDFPEAEKFINENLKQGKTVLIDSAGLNYPYFQFDGDYYHLLSRHPQSPPHAKPLLEKFKTETFKSDPKNKEIYFKKILPKVVAKKFLK